MLLLAVGTLAGLAVGVVRIAQGAHFLSDIVFAGVFMALVTTAVHHVMFGGPGQGNDGDARGPAPDAFARVRRTGASTGIRPHTARRTMRAVSVMNVLALGNVTGIGASPSNISQASSR